MLKNKVNQNFVGLHFFGVILMLALLLPLPASANTLMDGDPPQTVNINEDEAGMLAKYLHGVGVGKARAIVIWRENHGKFTSIDQLLEVKGIGELTLENNRKIIRIE